MNALRSTHKLFNREMGPDYPEPQKYAHQLSGMGGQHRVPQGASTFDDETEAESIERLCRAHAELNEPFDEQRITENYAYRWPGNPDRDEARLALEAFNQELQAAINREFSTQRF